MFSLLTCILNIAFFVDANIDPNLQSLQNRIISLERIVQQMSVDLKDLGQQHALLEHKYQAISDELKNIRITDSVKQSQSHFSSRTTETSRYNERSILTQGQKGDKGDPGERGPKGEAGTNGFNGDDGFDGQKGMKGEQGINGAKGDMGPQGVPGPTGHTGHTGIKGDKGDPGQPVSDGAIDTKVAFSASDLDTTPLVNQSPIILVFDRIHSNFGDDYNPSTGKFICTTPGTYVITWATEVKQNTAVRSYLQKNGKTMNVLSVTSPTMSSSSASQTIILHLDMNDRLYIEAQSIISESGVILRSSFAAFLLY